MSQRSAGARQQTLACSAGFVVLGLLVGALGPALPALKDGLGGSYKSMGVLFVARGAGNICGSMLGGYLLDRVSKGNRIFVGGLVVAGVGGGAVPLAPSLAVLAGTMLVMDTGLGVVIVCGNTLCTWSNLDNPTPAMNAINGAFGVGAFVSPLITLALQHVGARNSMLWTFWVIAAITVVTATSVALVPSSSSQLLSQGSPGGGTPKAEDRRRPVLVVPLTAMYIMLVVGAEISFGAFVVAYVVLKHDRGHFDMDAEEAELLSSVFWVVFTLGRFGWSGLSVVLDAHVILLCEMALLVLSVTLMAFFPSPPTLWAGAVVFGMGMSGCFAAAVGQMTAHVGMTGRSGGWVAVGASCGTFIQLLTSLVGEDPDAIMYCLFGTVCLSVVVMATFWALNGTPAFRAAAKEGGGVTIELEDRALDFRPPQQQEQRATTEADPDDDGEGALLLLSSRRASNESETGHAASR